MKKCLTAILLSLILMACSHSQLTKLIEEKDWIGLAHYDVTDGRKMRSEKDLKTLGALSMAAQKDYYSSYKQYVKQYCTSDNAYKEGMLGRRANLACIDGSPQGRMFENDWRTALESKHYP